MDRAVDLCSQYSVVQVPSRSNTEVLVALAQAVACKQRCSRRWVSKTDVRGTQSQKSVRTRLASSFAALLVKIGRASCRERVS